MQVTLFLKTGPASALDPYTELVFNYLLRQKNGRHASFHLATRVYIQTKHLKDIKILSH